MVLIIQESSNIHNHVFLTNTATYVERTLEDAVAVSKFLLLPRVKPVKMVFDGFDEVTGKGKMVPFIARRDF